MLTRNRRNFIRSLGRSIALVGAGFIGTLAFRKPIQPNQDAFCERINPCKACQELSQCGLPQAIAYKQETHEVKDHD